MTDEGYALELRGIVKRFGTTVALDAASLAVRMGTLHILLGENGAGKTTLLRIASGFLRADDGEMLLGGRPVRWRSRTEALDAGLAVVHQHFSLVPAMTVAENVALASCRLATPYSVRKAAESVRRIAEAAGLSLDPAAMVRDMPIAAQQRAEIIKAISRRTPILMLDEPTSVLSPPEAADLYRWLRGFVRQGHTVVVITHKIREAMLYGDAVTVLRGGRTTLGTEISVIDEAAVLSAILGEHVERPVRECMTGCSRPHIPHEGLTLELRDVTVVDSAGRMRLSPTSLSVHAGEVLGVAGVGGAGQRELLRVLAGRLHPSSGTVHLPRDIGFVPEDRLQDAIIPSFTLVENFALCGAGSRHGLVPWTVLAVATREAMRTFDVRAANELVPAASLSGGNQQKFVLARELSGSPFALVAENPARGLDVRAARDIFDRLRNARDAGGALVVYSSDLDELLSISTRIVVCHAGAVSEVPLDADMIGRAMIGTR